MTIITRELVFVDDYHEKLFNQFMAKLGQDDLSDRYYTPCAFLLALTGKDEIEGYLSDHVVRVENLKKLGGPWSSSERAILKLALHIFTGGSVYKSLSVDDVFYNLSDNYYEAVISAVNFRYYH